MNTKNDTTLLLLKITELFKESKWIEVIDLIKRKEIEPDYSENIISDSAALWLYELHLVEFFKEITKLGGNPTGHDSILKNCIKLKKNNAVKYLVDQNVLELQNDYICYFINIAIMDKNDIALDLLNKKLDLKKVKMLNEENPTCINITIRQQEKDKVKWLFKNKLIQDFVFSKETIQFLSGMDIKEDFKNEFINEIINEWNIKPNNKFIYDDVNNNSLELIFKSLECEVLSNILIKKEKPKVINKL